MKLLFKQRLFSWFDSYDIYDENGNTVFSVKGKLGWGHRLQVNDANGNPVAMLKEVFFSLLPRFQIYEGDQLVGSVKKNFTFLRPSFSVDFNGWQVEGNFFEWDYNVCDSGGNTIAKVSKLLLNWTDTYSIEVANPKNALYVLMLVLAIDAEKCSRND